MTDSLWEFAPIVEEVDAILDANVSAIYKEQPLAQHWARVAKAGEEAGEAVDALILWTGQNPRKPQNDAAFDSLLDELADTALTGIYGMQHFTKDAEETLRRVLARAEYHLARLRSATEAAA